VPSILSCESFANKRLVDQSSKQKSQTRSAEASGKQWVEHSNEGWHRICGQSISTREIPELISEPGASVLRRLFSVVFSSPFIEIMEYYPERATPVPFACIPMQ
jgi:hypothetical protein